MPVSGTMTLPEKQSIASLGHSVPDKQTEVLSTTAHAACIHIPPGRIRTFTAEQCT